MLSSNKVIAALAAFAVVSLTGCVGIRSFPTMEPITYKPSLTSPQGAVQVDTLTPTFKWKQPDPSATADFVIWKVRSDGLPGDVVYHAENITGGAHTITSPLSLNTEYFWSVCASGTNDWATMKYTTAYVVPTPVVGVGGYSVRRGIPFKIKTPAVLKS